MAQVGVGFCRGRQETHISSRGSVEFLRWFLQRPAAGRRMLGEDMKAGSMVET